MSLKGMMIRKIRAIDYDKLNKLASDIGKRNNKSASYVKIDMILKPVNLLEMLFGMMK